MQQDELPVERNQFLPDNYASIPAFGRVSCFESNFCFDDFELSSSLFPDSCSSFSLPSLIPLSDAQMDSQSTVSDESRDCSSHDDAVQENRKPVVDEQFLLPHLDGAEVSVSVRPFHNRICVPCGVISLCGNGPRKVEEGTEGPYCSVGSVSGTLNPENSESASREESASEYSACDSDCKQKSRFFPAEVREVLARFMVEHMDYPYATRREKQQLMSVTGLSEKSVTQFLSNWRRRHVLNPARKRDRRSFYSSGFERNTPFFIKQ